MIKTIGAMSAIAIAAGAMPAVSAQEVRGDDARAYVINVSGSTLPESVGTLDYPYKAASRGMSGECAIVMKVAETGAGQYDVSSCSNAAFEGAARDFADTVAFNPADFGETHHLTVVWDIEDTH